MGWETPRTAHLWIPAFAGMTRAGEGDAGVGGGGPLRVPSGQALRQAQGERILEARVRWGVGNAMGDGDAPRLAPLDSCLLRNDACGKALFECPQDRLRQAQGERIWEARLRWGEGVRWGTETPRASPLWIPSFVGMTLVGECRKDERWGRPAPRPCPGFPRERERRWGVWWDALARGVGVRVGARSRGRAVLEPPLRPGWDARGRG